METKCFGAVKKQQNYDEWMQNQNTGVYNGIDNSHNAYMLVYDKKIKHPFKINIAEAVVEAIRAGNEENLPNCFSLYPNLLE